jgi:hypothetical protein
MTSIDNGRGSCPVAREELSGLRTKKEKEGLDSLLVLHAVRNEQAGLDTQAVSYPSIYLVPNIHYF